MLHHIKHAVNHPTRWQRWLRDFILDLKFGKRYLGGKICNGDPSIGSEPSTSSDYEAISCLFSHIEINESDILIDIGCGKGRVFNWALNIGLKNKLIGVELDPEIAQFTRKRLQAHSQVSVITGNICKSGVIPLHGTIFYLFNPFTEHVLQEFSDQVVTLKQQNSVTNDRPIIIYYNCTHLHVFEKNPIWKIKKLGIVSSMNLPAAIITFNMD